MSQRYIKPPREGDDTVDPWAMPDVTEEVDYEALPTNALGLKPGENHEVIVEEEEEIPVLTAEELELIRKAAYEEGMLQGHEEGHAKGYEAGHKEGLEKGHSEGLVNGQREGEAAGAAIIEERAQVWSALARQLEKPLMHVDSEVEQSLVGLVVELAEEVIRCEIDTNPEVILKVLREATHALPLSARKLSISLNPDDVALVEQSFTEEMLSERGWLVSPDPTLNRGDCQITSEQSYVSVSLKQRVKELMERFLHQSVPAVTLDDAKVLVPESVGMADSPREQSEAEIEQSHDDSLVDTPAMPESIEPRADDAAENVASAAQVDEPSAEQLPADEDDSDAQPQK
ncbi:flagellar assembly protein FliH [Corallincola spongiicola]|uniref:Flagellar assembly protein FliH n=1 Tax=Corallincola spongiicola TaxID=2520508 RepID=A0ABY1WKJ6_9GAMM|nr:flagellar assembly protein FliH [Corallincola spongiicola]TAA40314.1 flagellar assembly protein FliH [Corallincola spongiicola]